MGVMSESLGHVRVFHTAYDVVGGQVSSLYPHVMYVSAVTCRAKFATS